MDVESCAVAREVSAQRGTCPCDSFIWSKQVARAGLSAARGGCAPPPRERP